MKDVILYRLMRNYTSQLTIIVRDIFLENILTGNIFQVLPKSPLFDLQIINRRVRKKKEKILFSIRKSQHYLDYS